MPLTFPSKTYPLAPNAVVYSLIPDGDTGFVGLTNLDAATIFHDPANLFCQQPSFIFRYTPGRRIVAFVFSEDGGKTYQALPILVRTPTDDPKYPHGLPVAGLFANENPAANPVFCFFFFEPDPADGGLQNVCLVREPHSGAPVLFAEAWTNSPETSPGVTRWTSQGDGKTAECWVTTRPQLFAQLSSESVPTTTMQQFFADVLHILPYNPPNLLPNAPYQVVELSGSPGLAFCGAETIFWYSYALDPSGNYKTPAQGTYVDRLYTNSPSVMFAGYGTSPVAQHPLEPAHVMRGTPGGPLDSTYAGELAQSYDGGMTTVKLFRTFGNTVLTKGDLFPINNRLLFEGDAIYSFGAWGFSVSLDGGQTWPGQKANGTQYVFSEMRTKDGLYFPDCLTTPDFRGLPSPMFSTLYDSNSVPFPMGRNQPAPAASAGVRVNSVQYLGPMQPAYVQQACSQTANFQGTFWHAVCFKNPPASGLGLAQHPLPYRWVLIRSQDLGATWEQMPEPPQIAYGMHLTVDRRTGWLHWGLQYTSRDGGQTWIASAPHP